MSTRQNCSNRWKPWIGGAQSGPAPSGDALLAVANIAALAALDTTTIDDGGVVAVKSVLDMFMLDKTSTLAPDGITVVAASGGGNWLRLEIPSQKWILQPNWYIDPVLGNDESGGAAAPSAIKTFAEWRRRVGSMLEVAQTIYLLDDVTEDVLFDQDGLPGVYVVVQGMRTVLYSGSVTAQVAWNDATTTYGQITDAALPVSWTASGLVGKLIVKTSGASAGSCGRVAKDLGAKSARYSPLIDANTFSVYDWAVGETFDVVDLTKLIGNVIVSGTAQIIPIDLHLPAAPGAGYNVFSVTGNGQCFPIYCDIESSAVQTTQGGYCDYIGCRLAPDSGDLYCAWQATAYLDACLVEARTRGEEDGTIGVLNNSLSQGSVGGGNVGVSFRNTQCVFTEWAWHVVMDQPTADPALYVSSGSTVSLPNLLWGNGGASNYAIVVLGGGRVVYTPTSTPTYGPSGIQDTNIGGLLRPYASLPANNVNKACGITLQ